MNVCSMFLCDTFEHKNHLSPNISKTFIKKYFRKAKANTQKKTYEPLQNQQT